MTSNDEVVASNVRAKAKEFNDALMDAARIGLQVTWKVKSTAYPHEIEAIIIMRRTIL